MNELYESVAGLPIVSPHGHIDAELFLDGARLDPPGRLFVTGDHYVLRMLYSRGIPMERLLQDDDRAVWELFSENLHLFAATPSGLWFRETLANVFGVEATSANAYDEIEEKLASPEFAPRALLDRFGVELLATTDPAGATLAAHRTLGDKRIVPTFRPDAVVALDAPGWRDALADLETAANREIGDYDGFLVALQARRAAFRELGATATDHAAMSADTTPLSHAEASVLFLDALAGLVSEPAARRFEAHMLHVFAGMSVEDGLVMQLHIGSLRNHNRPLAERFGPDVGGDIPVATDWTRGLRPLLSDFGNEPSFGLVLFTLDESTYSRELAPLAGHYPAVTLGCPWWFHDSPQGIRRFLDRVVETAGVYNLAGFVDDARALTAIPARHDLWRRQTCRWLAQCVEERVLGEDEAHVLARELAVGRVREAYRV